MADLSSAWQTCTSTISRGSNVSNGAWNRSLDALLSGGMGQPLSVWAVRLFEQRIKVLGERLQAVTSGEQYQEEDVRGAIATVHKEFEEMLQNVQDLENQLRSDTPAIVKRFLLSSRTILESMAPPSFPTVVYLLLGNKTDSQMSNSRERLSALMDKAEESHVLCVQLVDLGFSRVVEDVVSWIVFETIDELVSERTKGKLDTRALPTLWEWVDEFLVPWISIVLPHQSNSSYRSNSDDQEKAMEEGKEEERDRQLRQWRKRLSFHLHSSVGKIRIGQLLRLIDRFPKSLPALEDLKDCISSTDLKPLVTMALREQFTEKMLNAGTMTSDILKQYVNMIRALRFLDRSDVILESVSDPVHDYLRRRPDTVRCIVSDMTGDGELYEELERGRARRAAEEGGDGVSMDEAQSLSRTIREQDEDECLSIDGDLDADLRFDVEAYNTWEPDPIDAPSRDGKWRSGGDAITTLVAIYGSSEQIVNEYKGLLADKLSTHLEVDIQREVRVLQLLTERFGRETMHDCEIMLKDFADSIEIEQKLPTNRRRQLQAFETTVISKEFWPKLTEEPTFKAMPELEQQMALFGESYKRLKDPRVLNWQRSLGAVALKLEFEDGRKVDVTVSPIQATILHHFGERSRLSLHDLQAKLCLEDESFVRRKVQSLVNLGFLRAVDGSSSEYETVEDGGDVDVGSGEEEEAETGEEMGEAGGEEAEMAVYQSYVMAMLQNLKQLSLEQIHSMLQRFLQTPAYEKTQAQLAAFLARLVKEDKVELSAGMYRVKKK